MKQNLSFSLTIDEFEYEELFFLLKVEIFVGLSILRCEIHCDEFIGFYDQSIEQGNNRGHFLIFANILLIDNWLVLMSNVNTCSKKKTFSFF
jgi:hypothetical protein